MKEILQVYLEQKSAIHPISKRKLSIKKRMDGMYAFIRNDLYERNLTKEEKLFALSLLKEILEEV